MAVIDEIGLSTLLKEHSLDELLLALRVIAIAQDLNCGLEEIAVAVKIRDQQYRRQRMYHERHKESLN